MDKVVCIYNNKSHLTLNKVYNVSKRDMIKSTNGQLKPGIKLINDVGEEKWYGVHRFQDLDKHRTQKISKILKNA